MTKALSALADLLSVLTGPRLQMLALLVAGPVLTGMSCWLIWLVRYGWAPERAPQQLSILGWALGGAMALLGLVVAAMTAGLIKGFKLQGPAGISAEVDNQ